jgi:hypothetical protein
LFTEIFEGHDVNAGGAFTVTVAAPETNAEQAVVLASVTEIKVY